MKCKVSVIVTCCLLLVFGCKTPNKTTGVIDENGDLNLSESGHKIVFADKTLGQSTIIKDEVDGYFERIQELDMKIQMNSISRGDKATLLKDYKLHLQNSVMEWDELEKTFVGNVMEKAYELVNAINPDIFPKEIIMIKNNMNHYGEGVFYTRENSIVIPLNTIQNQDSADFLKTMIHEVFHIYARYHPAIKKELYKRIGYTKVEAPAIPEILKAKDVLHPATKSKWAGIETLIKITSSRNIKNVKQTETRYYISSEHLSAKKYNEKVRGHWSIENHLHWHLDVTFNEDACRARSGYAPENLNILRKFALLKLKEEDDKLSLKKRRFRASLNLEYLEKLLDLEDITSINQ